MNFVDSVLLLSDVTRLHRFSLIRSCEENFDLVNTWICTAIKRNVVEIFLDNCIEDDIKLPRMLFTCQSLVVLTLSNGILIQTPSSVWLPSLKTLHLLLVRYVTDDAIHDLLSECQALEELYIDIFRLDESNTLIVSVPSLKYLTIHSVNYVFDSEDEIDEPRHKLRIDAPKLKHLDLTDNVSNDFVMMNLTSLLEAYIRVGCLCRTISRFGGHILKLLSGISNVKSLCVLDSILYFLNNVNNFVVPTFHNLTRLKLEVSSSSGWNLLMNFLECSSKLEALVVENVDKLKEVNIAECRGKENELEAIKYLLKHGYKLKKMTIDCRQMKGKDDFRVCKKITGFPRGSMSCRVNLIF